MENECNCETSVGELATEILIARISVPGLGIHPTIEKVCEEYETIYRTIDRLVNGKSSEASGKK